MAIILVNGTRCIEMTCGTCGVQHAFPEERYLSAKREGGFWHCPNGHSRGWAKGESEEALAVAQRERDRLKQQNARLEEEVATIERARASAERALKTHKKRAAAGTCPCCNRTFGNMARHMKTKHPDYNVVPLKAVKA